MKLTDILLIGLTIAFIVIGVDQTLVFGFSQAYWAFMIALITFFVFTLRRTRKPESDLPKEEKGTGKKLKRG